MHVNGNYNINYQIPVYVLLACLFEFNFGWGADFPIVLSLCSVRTILLIDENKILDMNEMFWSANGKCLAKKEIQV